MNWKTVASSNLDAAGYDPATHEMQVQFSNGTIYAYPDVPQDVFDKLVAEDQESPGRYFASAIKANFAGSKVEPKSEDETVP